MRNYCIKCKNTITKEEYDFSMKKFKMALCRPHQISISSLNKKNKKVTPETKALGEELIKLGTPITLEQWDGYKHIDIAIVEKR